MVYKKRLPNSGKGGYVLLRNVKCIDGKKYQARFEHRVVMEYWLGRPILSSEQIHHINKNRKDNRISNLLLVTPEEHKQYHLSG